MFVYHCETSGCGEDDDEAMKNDNKTQVLADFLTSGNPQNSHHPNNGRVDGYDLTLHLFQHDAHHRQDHNEHIQLVPSAPVPGKGRY